MGATSAERGSSSHENEEDGYEEEEVVVVVVAAVLGGFGCGCSGVGSVKVGKSVSRGL